MKFALVCLLATASAITVRTTACLSANPSEGVLCSLEPADELEENNLFASGMDGEEDLDEDITIHGNPYRFLQGKKKSHKK